MARTVTLLDVSARAGVSRSTASLVVRGSSKVSARTRDKVLEAIQELGYVYNRSAAMMRETRSSTIGLVGTEIRNPFFAELIMALEGELYAKGYQLMVGYSRDEAERQRELVEAMAQRRVDGVIVLPAVGTDERAIVDYLKQSDLPVVQVVRWLSDRLDYVGPDNVAGGRLLAEHFVALGVRNAAFAGAPSDSSARFERYQGLVGGFSVGGVDVGHVETLSGANTPDEGARAMADLLDRGRLPDAVIAYSDAVALGIYEELRKRGLSAGRDIAVGSFDDIPFATQLVPPLTSVDTRAEVIAEAAARRLLERIENPEAAPEWIRVRPELKIRASTAQWRARS